LPELDIKQNYLMKKAMIQVFNNRVPNNYTSNEWQSPSINKAYNQLQYHKHALACGRHVELFVGSSALQKTASSSLKLIIEDQMFESMEIGYPDQSKIVFTERLNDRSSSLLNYIKGYYAIKNDQSMQRALQNALHDHDDIGSVIGIWSKEYKMS